MHLGTDEAAQRLQVSPRRLRALLESGRIPGQRVSGRWVVDDNDVAKFALRRTPGRPLSRCSAWQIINHIQDGEHQSSVGHLEPMERHRLNKRLQRIRATADPLDLICSMLATRAERFELSVSSVDLGSLRQDPRVRLSGVSHPAAGLLSNAEVEAYVAQRDYDAVSRDWLLVQAGTGRRANVVFHVAEEIPEKLPALLIAVDLAERGGFREKEAARELIRNLHLGWRWSMSSENQWRQVHGH